MQDTQPYRRPRQPHATRVRRPAPPRERRPANWGRRIRIVGIVLIALVVVGAVLLWQRAAAFNDAVSTESALSMRLFGPFGGSDRVNVLLLGYADETHDATFLSDSINVLSIDRATDRTTMIPIPRDLWVEGVEDVPQNMKINEAFSIGYQADGAVLGGELAAKAVTQVTGLQIDGWMALDFQGFRAMVDAIGGVTIENPVAFDYTWYEVDYFAGNFPYHFDAGTLRLDGARALDYARNRYTSVVEESSDFARLVRQQRILQAIKAEVSGWQTIPKGLALADALAEHLDTNLSVYDLGMLADKLEIDHRIELLEGEILQATTNTIGQYVLVPIGQQASDDYQPLHTYLSEELAAHSGDPARVQGSLEAAP